MSHTIKLQNEIYLELEALRGKRETFSMAVARLLTLHRLVGKILPLVRLEQGLEAQAADPGRFMEER